jgi:hypothetical protein|tara:strand:- start:229 stop:1551 length:1323 start_codon:yes stop_codon:yes gene_type:complete
MSEDIVNNIILLETINDDIIKVKKKYIQKKCEHGKNKYICVPCGGKKPIYKDRKKRVQKKCEHGKRKNICVSCGGIGLCIHKREKYSCKECGGVSICSHGRRKSACKECGGVSICEHNRVKNKCKECKGASICEHNRQRNTCKECGGASICSHGRRKSVCKECGGASICEHNRAKIVCKECGGNSICEHNRDKNKCIDCGCPSLCPHKRQKSQCNDCGGSAMCIHGRRRTRCKECGGQELCIHTKTKRYCKICGGSGLCKSSWCEKQKINKYNGYCMTCCIQVCPEIKISRNYKTKENDVVERIKNVFPNFTWVCDKKIQDGCSRKRPDLLLDLGSHIIIIEVDENKHTDYDCSCEHKRLMELSQDVGHRSIVFIRFNPDSYKDVDGKIVKSCWRFTKQGAMTIANITLWEERIETLKNQIKYWIDNKTEKIIEIIELYY